MNGYGEYSPTMEYELLAGSGFDPQGRPLPGSQAYHRSTTGYGGYVPTQPLKKTAQLQPPSTPAQQAAQPSLAGRTAMLTDSPRTKRTRALIGGQPEQPAGKGMSALNMAKGVMGMGGSGGSGGGSPTIEPRGTSEYASGMPRRPHAAPGAQAWGNALVSEGNSAIEAAPMMGPAAPYVAIAGGVAKTVGTGLQLYAALEDADQAKKEYEMLMDEWKKMKRREEADYKREVERQRMQDIAGYSSQAAALEDRFATSYGGYRAGGQY